MTETIEKRIMNVKPYINEYCQREFCKDADYSDPSKVGLAYTTITDDELEIQVNANLVDLSIDKYIEGVLVESIKFSNIDDMCTNLLYLDFDALVEYTDEEIECAERITR